MKNKAIKIALQGLLSLAILGPLYALLYAFGNSLVLNNGTKLQHVNLSSLIGTFGFAAMVALAMHLTDKYKLNSQSVALVAAIITMPFWLAVFAIFK